MKSQARRGREATSVPLHRRHGLEGNGASMSRRSVLHKSERGAAGDGLGRHPVLRVDPTVVCLTSPRRTRSIRGRPPRLERRAPWTPGRRGRAPTPARCVHSRPPLWPLVPRNRRGTRSLTTDRGQPPHDGPRRSAQAAGAALLRPVQFRKRLADGRDNRSLRLS